jgi:hypothetical protein
MNTIAIAMCVFFIFGIMAVQLLGGQMHFCTDEFVLDKKNCTGTNFFTNQTREWEYRRIKYDWIGMYLIISAFFTNSSSSCVSRSITEELILL